MRRRIVAAPNNLALRQRLVNLLTSLAPLEQHAQTAPAIWQEASRHQRLIVSNEPENEAARAKLSDLLWNSSDAFRKARLLDESRKITEERVSRWSGNGTELFYAAWEMRMLSECFEAGTPNNVEALSRSAELLEQSRLAGFSDVQQVKMRFAKYLEDERFKKSIALMESG